MRVLVTGTTGFVCGAVLRALARRGHDAIALVRDRRAAPPIGAPIVWDLAQSARPDVLPRGIDAIVHGAQSRDYRNFPADGGAMFRTNVAGTWSLLDYAAESGIKRFCLLSSGTVYEPYRGPLDEKAATAPTSFLGATKLAAEVVARPYGAMLGLCVLRLFAPYGRGQRDRLVPDIAQRVRDGRAVELASDGQGLWLTPTHVDDVAEVVTTAVEEEWTGTVNVAAPEVVSLKRLAETIGGFVDRDPVFRITEREPLRIEPSLERLAERFDLGRFRLLQRGLHDTFARDCGEIE